MEQPSIHQPSDPKFVDPDLVDDDGLTPSELADLNDDEDETFNPNDNGNQPS